MLVRLPALEEVTLTDTVQLVLAGIDAPDKLKLPAPGIAVMMPETQVVVASSGDATIMPEGILSVKFTPT